MSYTDERSRTSSPVEDDGMSWPSKAL
jgi:hypothetical protein